AYSELERLGVIETRPGKGHFLNEHHRPLERGLQRRRLTGEMDSAPRSAKKTLRYWLLTLLLGALYLALVFGAGALMVGAGLIRGESVAVLATAIVAALFLPLRSRVQQFVDRLVFAKRFELPRALQFIKAEAASQPDLESFMERVSERADAILGARPELIREHAEVVALVNSFPSLRSASAPVSAGADLLMPVFS